MPIIRYEKLLECPPLVKPTRNARIRVFRDDMDVGDWLSLHQSAMSGSTAAGRAWQAADFQREFTDQAWFTPSHMWVAEPLSSPVELTLVGSVTLELRPPANSAVIHWLLVAPQYRRAGIASHLLRLAESTAWQAGCPTMRLETLLAWRDACAFYEALGYSGRRLIETRDNSSPKLGEDRRAKRAR
jgi:GNAT superfamily N-acetyltransferase